MVNENTKSVKFRFVKLLKVSNGKEANLYLSDMKIKKGTITEGLLWGFLWLSIMWLVKIVEVTNNISLAEYGLYPRDWKHLYGIVTIPFLHGDWNHLLANTSPFLVLTLFIVLGYRNIYMQVNLIVLLLGGFWTWLLGRSDFHIGASGVIYGYASFLFFAGIFSKNYRMMALSMLVVFLYGSLFWGIFPIQQGVSWEGHLCGAAAGCVAAFAYRKKLPGRKVYDWENEEEDDDEEEKKENPEQENLLVRYYYTEVNKDENKTDPE